MITKFQLTLSCRECYADVALGPVDPRTAEFMRDVAAPGHACLARGGDSLPAADEDLRAAVAAAPEPGPMVGFSTEGLGQFAGTLRELEAATLATAATMRDIMRRAGVARDADFRQQFAAQLVGMAFGLLEGQGMTPAKFPAFAIAAVDAVMAMRDMGGLS